jgi:acyl-CoA thioesterase I
MPFALEPNQTLLFTGDSITDCGRRAAEAPLGSGYVRQVADLIVARYPEHQLRIINTGISGNTLREITNRLTDDVIRHDPHWLSLMIGINDIHRWLRKSPDPVSPEEYAQMYDAVLHRITKETRARLVLIDPFYISLETSRDSFRAVVLEHLPSYLQTVQAMARKYKARHVRMHEVFQQLLKCYPPDRFCPEPVHPNPSGHLVMAHAWLKTMGY